MNLKKIYENYISQCDSIVFANDSEKAKALVEEIVSAFSGE